MLQMNELYDKEITSIKLLLKKGGGTKLQKTQNRIRNSGVFLSFLEKRPIM